MTVSFLIPERVCDERCMLWTWLYFFFGVNFALRIHNQLLPGLRWCFSHEKDRPRTCPAKILEPSANERFVHFQG
jgi:hypothetical protein